MKTQQLEKQILEQKIELGKIIESMNGETVVKFLVKAYEQKNVNPEIFYGKLNDRDHLVDVALERLGIITNEEANKRWLDRNEVDNFD